VQQNLLSGERVVFHLDFTCTLGAGSYSVSPALVSTETHMVDNYEWVDNLLVFDVMNADQTTFIGSNWLDATFRVERNGTPAPSMQAD
jgi:lipopolysaccharide transport system ATP-binding protein